MNPLSESFLIFQVLQVKLQNSVADQSRSNLEPEIKDITI